MSCLTECFSNIVRIVRIGDMIYILFKLMNYE